MKKLLVICLALSMGISMNAQKKNLVKINFLSPVVKTLNLQYERALTEKSSFQLGFFYTGAKSGDVSLTGIGITPEYRMYFSDSKQAPAGFFLAPFVRYQNFTLKNENTTVGEAKASLSAFRPGLLIGYQWVFSDVVSFEFFLGPSYSINSLKVKTSGASEDDFSVSALDGFGIRSGLTIGVAF